MGRRAGTENVAGIVGLGKACEIASASLAEDAIRMRTLRDRLHEGIAGRTDGVRLNGHSEYRLPNTLNLSFQGLDANRLLEEIGREVAASAGAACHAGSVAVSHVLDAMRVPIEWARGALRFSLGRMTTPADIDRAVDAVTLAVTGLRNETK